MSKLWKQIKFFFLWRETIKTVNDIFSKDALYYPYYINILVSKIKIREEYLRIGDFRLVLGKYYADLTKTLKRNKYKRNKRVEFMESLSPEDKIYLHYRYIRWTDYLREAKKFREATKQFNLT